MSLIDKTSGQGPQWIQPEGTQQVSNDGRVRALRNVFNKMLPPEDQVTPKKHSIHERGVRVIPPTPKHIYKTSSRPRRPAPKAPDLKPQQQPAIEQKAPTRPRSQVLTKRPPKAKSLASRSISKPATASTNALPQSATIQKATSNLLDHHLAKISSASDRQAQYRELIATFKTSSCVEGDDAFSDIQEALRDAANKLESPGVADDPAAIQNLKKHFYRRLVTEGAKLLKQAPPERTVKKVPPKPPVRTSSLPNNVAPTAKNTEPASVQKTPVTAPEKVETEPTSHISEISLPVRRQRKRQAALDAPAKYMSKSLAQGKDTPWKEQMPKFFTRYLRAMALTGASEKASVDKKWFKHEVPGASIFSNKSSVSDTQKELRNRLEDIAFQKGESLTGFYRFFDQHQLGRNVRMAAVSQMMLPLSEHGHLDPMSLQDLEPNSGKEVSQWLNQQLDVISQREYQNYTALLDDLKNRTEGKYRVKLDDTPFGKVPLESITAKTHGEGVFKVARVNSFQYTLDHCTPWLKSAHPVTDKFAELRLKDTTGKNNQKLSADQLEDLHNQAKGLLSEMSQINMNKVPKSVQDTMASEKKSLERIIDKYQDLAKQKN
ncbi:hypothetical protein [Endozoicomonas sp. ISHI1]|uniref:hypothetical protein n=1 Tax=Endozoicomonas sp. ISHI1 TaxID=2825882 RepID=UPI0021480604|nr:hypothetical protein [Endozoicomonas sp. ISHI1]